MALATVFQKDFEDFSQTNPLSQTYQRFGGNRAAVYPETEEEGRERRAMTSEYRTTRLHFSRKKTMHKKSLYCSVSSLSTGNSRVEQKSRARLPSEAS